MMTTASQRNEIGINARLKGVIRNISFIFILSVGVSMIETFPVHAQELIDESGRYYVESISSGVNEGIQLALDTIAGRIYVADAQWRIERRDLNGDVYVARTASGKLVVFDSANRSLIGIHSFLDLSRADGTGSERHPLNWGDLADTGPNFRVSVFGHFSPNGLAVDSTTLGSDGKPDATIVTTTARGLDAQVGYGGHMVIYNTSQGGPTDSDRIWQFEDGSPIFDGMRRVVVNTTTHKAYITNMGERSDSSDRRPGFIVVVDLQTRKVEARVQIPVDAAPISVAVDEENNLVYVGSMANTKLHVFDAGEVDISSPQDLTLNAGLVTRLDAAEVGSNSRPEYDAATKRLYVAAFDQPSGTITVIDADPISNGYGTVLRSAQAGQVNALTVDAERGLLISANLGDKEVVVHDLNTLDVLLRVPTSGEPTNTVVDPSPGSIWVANAGSTGKVDVITLKAPK
jgi:DNA-binding beta-propeller fold protein YncE